MSKNVTETEIAEEATEALFAAIERLCILHDELLEKMPVCVARVPELAKESGITIGRVAEGLLNLVESGRIKYVRDREGYRLIAVLSSSELINRYYRVQATGVLLTPVQESIDL